MMISQLNQSFLAWVVAALAVAAVLPTISAVPLDRAIWARYRAPRIGVQGSVKEAAVYQGRTVQGPSFPLDSPDVVHTPLRRIDLPDEVDAFVVRSSPYYPLYRLMTAQDLKKKLTKVGSYYRHWSTTYRVLKPSSRSCAGDQHPTKYPSTKPLDYGEVPSATWMHPHPPSSANSTYLMVGSVPNYPVPCQKTP